MLFYGLIALVAFLYATVGHGGASGYIAVMGLFQFPPATIAVTALYLNLGVASLSFFHYARLGYFSWRLTWPWVAVASPFAFLGGTWAFSNLVYYGLFAAILLFSAWRLTQNDPEPLPETIPETQFTPAKFMLAVILGLASGITGVGGGIFLTPLLVLFRWATPKVAAPTSALFILVNSMAGLLGRWHHSGEVPPLPGWELIVICLGAGWLGAELGAKRFSIPLLKKLLAGVLLLASLKMIQKALG